MCACVCVCVCVCVCAHLVVQIHSLFHSSLLGCYSTQDIKQFDIVVLHQHDKPKIWWRKFILCIIPQIPCFYHSSLSGTCCTRMHSSTTLLFRISTIHKTFGGTNSFFVSFLFIGYLFHSGCIVVQHYCLTSAWYSKHLVAQIHSWQHSSLLGTYSVQNT